MMWNTRFARLVLIPTVVMVGLPAAHAIQFTSREKSACKSEAIRFCMSAYPSKRDLVSCLQRHKSSLGRRCRRVFENGMDRRGMN